MSKIVLWAINPFEQETRPQASAIEELKQWCRAADVKLQPVHVLYISAVTALPEENGSWAREFVPAVEAEMTNYLTGMDLPGLLEPKVLIQRDGFTRAAVQVLVQYAKDVDAAWILVSSKGRSGIRRLALGSFAESLLIQSPVPVWVFGHGDAARLDSQRILFATNFSDASQFAFNQVVEQAKRMGSKVTLFHCIELPTPIVSSAGVMSVSNYIPVEEYVRDQRAWAESKASEWAKLAKGSDVTVDLVVQEVVPSIANAIVSEAGRLSAGLIALASVTGAVGAALLGSHTRQVIRQSECPVWVFGPGQDRQALKEKVS